MTFIFMRIELFLAAGISSEGNFANCLEPFLHCFTEPKPLRKEGVCVPQLSGRRLPSSRGSA